MRQICFLVVCFLLLSSIPEAPSQEVSTGQAEVAIGRDVSSGARLVEDEGTLRAFRAPEEAEVLKARSLVVGLLVGVFTAVIIMFVLFAFFYEPSEAAKPHRATEAERPGEFTPWKPKQETRRGRVVIDDE